ncbi:bifunctional 3-(3-hydroxy-phenyl)propionate/3-hydroxycinnamic acid hydroxylase [Georgenia sp. EYE_87]|uniref:bifunctional 3-(3-hydroxy-phenyl)propionate/3-hydroxycinnamic acid hydroxylase MhpA n=1 Tax=Georgenia sp. EYE_87 TaxID=2853448 RepID=UPI00200362FB|nr:bifunctional 3-(3-hydroxy-phenyl)propionate/3-hydroxycinnamic acid hydroxylase [Georgenia sp. EYE_87]MCK6211084.1 bifunctional 3-(3-hydroxy-phenyl)propionate/3-hydroxycinnamic acid hydroxylase [Georgenia sp. EYE_87]
MTDSDAAVGTDKGAAVGGQVHDVVVVGLGPVGQSLALLLARQGHDVVAVDRWTEPYELPRAVHYDPDISRLLDGLGLRAFMADFASPTDVYEWQNAERRTLLRFAFAPSGDQGWPESSMFHQPSLERAMRRRSRDFPNIRVYRGTEVVGVRQEGQHAEVLVRSSTLKQRRLKARYVIGCDGANSFVRQYMDTSVEDLGFFYDWLICDVLPREERTWEPDNLQVCDPARPVTAVNSGPGRRRFEFMRMPGDDRTTTFATTANSWRLLEPWGITPENAVLERSTIYTFQARWARRWRDGRLLLAGDAAHQMPPFFGQGMVSGMRDSINLAWKLDLVLRDVAGDTLLDTYDSERSAHVQHAIGMSVELGRVICATDPDVVASRDAHLLATGPDPERALPPVPPERLGPGAFAPRHLATPLAGQLGVQGRVGLPDGAVDLLDVWTFGRFVLLCDGRRVDDDAARDLRRAFPAELGAVVVRLLPRGAEASRPGEDGVLVVTDEDDRHLPRLEEHGLAGELVRPDFHVYGGGADLDTLPALVRSLAEQLHLAVSSGDRAELSVRQRATDFSTY